MTQLEHESSSLDALVMLDCLKERLSQSAQALRQADNWTTLATEVEEVREIYLYTYKTLVILIVCLFQIVCLRPCVRILDTEWLLKFIIIYSI